MATIYAFPNEVKQPDLMFGGQFNQAEYTKKCDEAKEQVKEHMVKIGYNPQGKNFGELVQFPFADSYAEYMVVSMRPLHLIHMPFWDGWDDPRVDRLKAADIQNKIDSQKALDKLFGGK